MDASREISKLRIRQIPRERGSVGIPVRQRRPRVVDVHLAVVRRVEDLERALEALRLEQELEVRLAARPQERHDGFVRLDGLDAAGGSRGKRRVASMAYEPPQTLRTQRADISAFVSVPLQSTSMRSKHLRAAFKNSLLNSSISLAARAASSSLLSEATAGLSSSSGDRGDAAALAAASSRRSPATTALSSPRQTGDSSSEVPRQPDPSEPASKRTRRGGVASMARSASDESSASRSRAASSVAAAAAASAASRAPAISASSR